MPLQTQQKESNQMTQATPLAERILHEGATPLQLNPRQHYYIVPDFYAQAAAMRACIDEHFDKPFAKSGPTHQIWDYWYVPNLYTYLRTDPKHIIPARLMHMFHDTLTHWAIETLGLSNVSNPYLSLYVNGCGQGVHNDAKNGRWAFVFSLTNWERRKFTGGETIVFRDENYWETNKIMQPSAGHSFYDLVPSLFNQLVVFDDRAMHAVQPLQGTMDPREGRFVIHGHIREGRLHVQGSLSQEEVERVVQEAQLEIQNRLAKDWGQNYHGLATFRVWVDSSGLVSSVQVLTDRILRIQPQGPAADTVSDMIIATLQSMIFPSSADVTRITLPVVVNNTL
jgi:hypothetical protein